MTAHILALTHGLLGFKLANVIFLVPMLVGLIRQRASLRHYLLWPLVAAPVMLIALLIFGSRAMGIDFLSQLNESIEFGGLRVPRLEVATVLVTALLVIPAATAKLLARSLRQMFVLTPLLGTASVLGGMLGSYYLDLPSGPAIVVLSGLLFLGVGLSQGKILGARRKSG